MISKFEKKTDKKSAKNAAKCPSYHKIIGFQESMDHNIVIQGSGAAVRRTNIHHIIQIVEESVINVLSKFFLLKLKDRCIYDVRQMHSEVFLEEEWVKKSFLEISSYKSSS